VADSPSEPKTRGWRASDDVEQATLTFDRSGMFRRGARAFARGGRLDAAVKLIKRLGRRPTDLELRLRAHELREIEALAEAAARR
jgi:hypothetical protein